MSDTLDAAGRPAMIMVALNGARRQKSDFSPLPVTPDEIGEQAAACADAGAAALHVHVRARDGGHLLDADAYRAATRAIRNQAGAEIVIQITTEAVGIYRPEQQIEVVEAVRPEAVSLAPRELVPDEARETRAAAFFAWLKAESIWPQFILYEPSEIARFADLCGRGVIPFARPFVLFALGYHGEAAASPGDLDGFLKALHGAGLAVDWAICAFGRRESDCAAAAFAQGGHMRAGFENNIEAPDGTPLTSNAQSVLLVREKLEALGRTPMSGAQARSFMQAGL
jgi:uncharacterized protein (DUF849 family)